jgi:hypothetical protein
MPARHGPGRDHHLTSTDLGTTSMDLRRDIDRHVVTHRRCRQQPRGLVQREQLGGGALGACRAPACRAKRILRVWLMSRREEVS